MWTVARSDLKNKEERNLKLEKYSILIGEKNNQRERERMRTRTKRITEAIKTEFALLNKELW